MRIHLEIRNTKSDVTLLLALLISFQSFLLELRIVVAVKTDLRHQEPRKYKGEYRKRSPNKEDDSEAPFVRG